MSDSKSSSVSSENEFDLKHRITGAAVLLFFGALVLPWLLGPPSEASKVPVVSGNSQETSGLGPAAVESDLLSAIENEQEEIEETVYISRITPFDAGGTAPAQSEPSPEKVVEPKADVKPVASPEVAVETKEKPPVEVQKDKQVDTKKEVDTVQKDQPKVAKNEPKPKADPALLAALKAEDEKLKDSADKESQQRTAAPKIDVGWVVQVGVFTDKKGAENVVNDLREKGFSPSITIVDTNRGKKTGTRVWLGPFAQRVQAAKEKTRLNEKTGEPGFIRAYP